MNATSLAGFLSGQLALAILLLLTLILMISQHKRLNRWWWRKRTLERAVTWHTRAVEALALAIEAKDQASCSDLGRMRLYCAQLGADLGLGPGELETLEMAAILHDVGKLAVPDHILSKPGRLTQEEFDKIKVHPVVGSEILERAGSPRGVACIVRAHHEKWDGSGYPGSLKGEQIPMAARVLAVADCLDALLSDRPQRFALKMPEAVARIRAESGVSFDPRVVAALERRYADLEVVPAAKGPECAKPLLPPFLEAIAAARQEQQVLLELMRELGNSLHLDQTLSVLYHGLKRVVPYDSMVMYVLRQHVLCPCFVRGEGSSRFRERDIPLGAGIAGWVARHRTYVFNGNPFYELGPGAGPAIALKFALAVPLVGFEDVMGVLMICRGAGRPFTIDELRLLLTISGKLGVVAENALKYEQAAESATIDFLTGLPNARALDSQLQIETARAARLGNSFTVMVADLDGFKQVNDRFGHLEGNSVLRAVARVLRQSCREYDYVARLGGDEFVLILPGVGMEELRRRILQLDAGVGLAAREVCPEVDLRLSVGCVSFPNDGDDGAKLLALADDRMYRAKQLRRLLAGGGPRRGFDFDQEEARIL